MSPDPLQSCPTPSERRITLRVTAAAERSLRHGHPWLYDQAITRQSHPGRAGDLAVIFDRERRFLAIGLYDPDSPLRVRVLRHRRPAPIDEAWFAAQLARAIAQRAGIPATETTGYRLVHGENDGLPGLVIDRYGRTLVLKLYTTAWVPHLRPVLAALASVAPAERLVLRLSRIVQRQPSLLYGLTDGVVLAGPPLHGPIVFRERGLQFEVDPVRGQKTGFFLDQRENRARVESLCAGRTVLDAFGYTGGFSVYAARGGARDVTTVEVSQPALDAARRNMARNRDHPAVEAASHRMVAGDAFDTLRRFRDRGAAFDVVLLDPPAFAKTRDEVGAGLLTYRRLARLGLEVLRPGGTLMFSSCSSHVSPESFFQTVRRAAVAAKRPLREIERTGHPADHPIGFAEGAYLKCLFAIAGRAGKRSRVSK